MNLFGYSITKDDKKKSNLKAFEIDKDLTAENYVTTAGGVYVYNYNLVTVPENEVELIKTYRKISKSPEIDQALNEIRNEIFVFDVPGKRAVDIDFLDNSSLSDQIKKKISEEYSRIYDIIDFDLNGINYFMDWYIDGKLYLHKVIDTNNPKEGIKKVIQIDPLKIKKIREIPKSNQDGTYNIEEINEYYVYIDRQPGSVNFNKALKIHPDSITYIDSGIYDKESETVLSHLYKAIIPYNNLKLMEDSLVIYRVSRSPERRVIYVDVGNLPKNKAEQYIRELMNRFKNKLVYDSKTGSIADRRNVLSMIEDYWLPRRDGGKGTEISTLPGGDNLGIIQDVEYFQKKLYQSLNVPYNRFRDDSNASLIFGRATEIDRDEYRFKKFIDRLRLRFMMMFEDILKTQLILKKIITERDWDEIRRFIQWRFTEDNNFVEIKENEILNNRIEMLSQVDPFVGKYFTEEWVMKNVLKMTDDEIQKMKSEIQKEPMQDDKDEDEETGDMQFENLKIRQGDL